MRISELSRHAGVSVPTIKYYIREGLLLPGAKAAPNQAQYADEHLQRLTLIRVLREVGGLRVDAIKTVLAALEQRPGLEVVGMVHSALSPPWSTRFSAGSEEWNAAADEVYAALTSWGWAMYRETPTFRYVVDAYLAAKSAWPPEWPPFSFTGLRPYAAAAQMIAKSEIGGTSATQLQTVPAADLMRRLVLSTVLIEPILLALRRLAQQDQALKMWRRGEEQRPADP